MFFYKLRRMFGINSMKNNMRARSIYNYKLISFEQARNMINMNEAQLIDVRSSQEYGLMHIKGAINIPIDEFETKITSSALSSDKPVIVYCSSGSRSKKAIQILNKYNYNVYIWEYAALANFPYRDMFVYEKR